MVSLERKIYIDEKEHITPRKSDDTCSLDLNYLDIRIGFLNPDRVPTRADGTLTMSFLTSRWMPSFVIRTAMCSRNAIRSLRVGLG